MVDGLRNQSVCITSDGWTNINGHAVVNYMIAHRGKAYFLEAVATKTQDHTGEWIAKDLCTVIDGTPWLDTVGVVTDNTAANKLAWRSLGDRYKDKFFYGPFTTKERVKERF